MAQRARVCRSPNELPGHRRSSRCAASGVRSATACWSASRGGRTSSTSVLQEVTDEFALPPGHRGALRRRPHARHVRGAQPHRPRDARRRGPGDRRAGLHRRRDRVHHRPGARPGSWPRALRAEITRVVSEIRFSIFDLRHEVTDGRLAGVAGRLRRARSASGCDFRVHLLPRGVRSPAPAQRRRPRCCGWRRRPSATCASTPGPATSGSPSTTDGSVHAPRGRGRRRRQRRARATTTGGCKACASGPTAIGAELDGRPPSRRRHPSSTCGQPAPRCRPKERLAHEHHRAAGRRPRADPSGARPRVRARRGDDAWSARPAPSPRASRACEDAATRRGRHRPADARRPRARRRARHPRARATPSGWWC